MISYPVFYAKGTVDSASLLTNASLTHKPFSTAQFLTFKRSTLQGPLPLIPL